MTNREWSQREYCFIGNSPEMLRNNIPDGLQVKLFLTDPPYNIGHNYGDVDDKRSKSDYKKLISDVLKESYKVADDSAHFFMIHYPEAIAEMWDILTKESGWKFHQWITWAYPSNFGFSNKKWTRASRTIIWLQKKEGGDPTFYPNRIVRPFRNPWDKRVKKSMEEGKKGCSLYDWWEINLVKNVNPEKRDYANQIPQKLLERIIRSTTDIGDLVADPFSGTYSTMRAALNVGRFAWGCDLNKETEGYWPDENEFKASYEEKEFDFDLGEDREFDLVRARIEQKDLEDLIQHAMDVGEEIAKGKRKWIEQELRFLKQIRDS